MLKAKSGGSIELLKARIKRLQSEVPITVAYEVAQSAAPKLTALVQGAHLRKESIYGVAYSSYSGNDVDVYAGGDTRRTLKFSANGRVVRATLGPKYAKYLIGKYGLLPRGKEPMPAAWGGVLEAAAREIAVKEIKK